MPHPARGAGRHNGSGEKHRTTGEDVKLSAQSVPKYNWERQVIRTRRSE
jgi:hypothetical protein